MNIGSEGLRRGGRRIVLILICFAFSQFARPSCEIGVMGELPVTMVGTEPVISGSINGTAAHFLADSGSFYSLLTKTGAEKFALRPTAVRFGYYVTGTGGTSTPELATAQDFALQGLHGSLHRVDFLVIDKLRMPEVDGIIGQNILRIVDTEFDLGNGVIRLVREKDCGARGAVYWTRNDSFGVVDIERITREEPHIIGSATINGQKIRVLFDTGASTSILQRRVAARVGVTPESPGTASGGFIQGVGSHRVETWLAPFKSLELGGEKITNIKVRFGDLEWLDRIDMLVGADFFLAHRIYVAKNQNKLYFTYNGGPVFDLRVRNDAAVTAAAAPESRGAAADVPPQITDAPTDAAGFRRRAAAFAARGDMASALRDLDRAVELDPANADGLFERARARLLANQRAAALEDLGETLRRRPADVQALLLRGELRLGDQDLAGASSDFDAAAQAAPEDETVELGIASAYERAGQSRHAIARLDEWIASHPTSSRLPSALNSRCWTRAVLGQELELALADCNAASVKAPRVATILNSRGLVHLRRGEFDAAIRDYQASIALDPQAALSFYGLGVAELRKGMKDNGERHLQSALKLNASVAEVYQRMGVSP